MKTKNKIVVFVGPSGSGKTTAIRWICKNIQGFKELVSVTTRDPRINEVDGVDYYYRDRQFFYDNADDFIEMTEYSGNLYGLTVSEIEEKRKDSNVVVACDIHGLRQLEARYDSDELVSIFVLADVYTLAKRMEARGDSASKVWERLNNLGLNNELDNDQYCQFVIDNSTSLPNFYKAVKGVLEGVGFDV